MKSTARLISKNFISAKMSPVVLLLWAISTLFGVACDTGNEDDLGNEGDGDSNEDSAADTEDDTTGDTASDIDGGMESDSSSEEEAPYTTALVITTDYTTGSYSTVDIGNRKVKKDIDTIHSDSVCRFDPLTDTPFIVRRMGEDAIDVLDPDTFAIEEEYSAEPTSNPQDIAVVSEERAYISRYNLAKMLIVEPFTGDEIGVVDLSNYADDDGLPEVSGLAFLNDTLYAPVQRIDQSSWEAQGGGAVVMIDAMTGDIEGDVKLTGETSNGAPELCPAVGQFVITEQGLWSELDGGIELFDPVTKTMSGFIVTEEELGGNASKGLVLAEDKGYAVIGVMGDLESDTHVVSFDPKTGKKKKTLLEGDGWIYTDIALSPDGSELWITDRTAENPGIRIFDTNTDEEITDGPINVGLPPSMICFTR